MNLLTPDTGLIIWQIVGIAAIALTLFILGAVLKWAIRQYRQ